MLGDDLLIGAKVRLTAMEKSDLPPFKKWLGSMDLRRQLSPGLVFPVNDDDEESFWESVRKDPLKRPFAIRTLEGEHLIGNCGFNDVMWQARRARVGIMIGAPTYRGKGYGTDAMRVLLCYAFMEANFNRVDLEVFAYNVRAIKSYEKCGFTLEGTLRQALWRDGEFHDMHIMGILRDEWRANQL